jgi:hypothetical protein
MQHGEHKIQRSCRSDKSAVFELVVNMKAAKAFGLYISESNLVLLMK